ncbi:MAG: hypothetical protein K9H11_13115, partial [Rhodospirillum sp.]|nr:hypothetical protein [Rhodospirillum sp.]
MRGRGTIRGALWGLVLLALGLWGGWNLASGRVAIDGDFLSLIGRERSEDGARAPIDAVRHLLVQDGRRAVFMVSAPNRTLALDTADALAAALAALPGTLSASGPGDRQRRGEALRAFYAPQAGALLADADRADLEAGRGDRVAQRGLAALYAPTTPLDGESLRRDPFSLHQRALLDRIVRLGGNPDPARRDGRVHTAVHVTLAQDPRASGGDGAWVAGAEAATAALTKGGLTKGGLAKDGVTIQRTGQIFFALAEGSLARSDVQRIGLFTGLGLLALVVLVFASWTPIAATLLTVGSGLVTGLAAVTALFPALHAIALVFGASLIGISVDYAFHYLAQ